MQPNDLEYDMKPGYFPGLPEVIARVAGPPASSVPFDPDASYLEPEGYEPIQIRRLTVWYPKSPLKVGIHDVDRLAAVFIFNLDLPYKRKHLLDCHHIVQVLKKDIAKGGRPFMTPDQTRKKIVQAWVETGVYTLVSVAELRRVDDRTVQFWRDRSGAELAEMEEEARLLRPED